LHDEPKRRESRCCGRECLVAAMIAGLGMAEAERWFRSWNLDAAGLDDFDRVLGR